MESGFQNTMGRSSFGCYKRDHTSWGHPTQGRIIVDLKDYMYSGPRKPLRHAFSNSQTSTGTTPQTLSDLFETDILGVFFDADHESDLRFAKFGLVKKLWPN